MITLIGRNVSSLIKYACFDVLVVNLSMVKLGRAEEVLTQTLPYLQYTLNSSHTHFFFQISCLFLRKASNRLGSVPTLTIGQHPLMSHEQKQFSCEQNNFSSHVGGHNPHIGRTLTTVSCCIMFCWCWLLCVCVCVVLA